MMKVSLRNCERVSNKTKEPYKVLEINLECSCGVGIVIEDFGVVIPYDLDLNDVTLEKNEYGRWILKEIDYQIPYKYNLAVNLLYNHHLNCKGVK